MEVIFNVISALLWFSIISSVAASYVYDDVSRIFMPNVNELAHAKYGLLHKKRFSGNGNPRYVRGPGDLAMHNSHFRVMKAPLMSFDEVQSWNAREQQVHRITESYKAVQERTRALHEERKHELKGKPRSIQWDKKENKVRKMGNIGKDNRFDPKYNAFRVERNNVQDTQTKETRNDNGIMKGNGNVKDDNGFIKQSGNVKERQDTYRREGKGNVNKELLSDTQKSVKVTNSRLAAVSQFPTHYRWVPLLDKGEKKSDRNAVVVNNAFEDLNSNKKADRNAAVIHVFDDIDSNKKADPHVIVMHNVFDDVNTKKKADRSSVVIQNVYEDINGKMTNKYDSKKRETSVVTKAEMPRPLSRENRVKFTRIAKEVMSEQFARVEPRGSGSSQLHFETKDVPYAVFYRTNPVTIDDQDEVLMDTDNVEGNSNGYTEKMYKSGDDMISQSKLKPAAKLKRQKTMKNFSNFKTL